MQFSNIKCFHTPVWPSPPSISRIFSSSQIESVPINQNYPFLPPSCSWQPPSVCSLSLYNLTSLCTSSKWNHAVFVPLCLGWFHLIMSSSFIRGLACVRISFLFKAEYHCMVPYFICSLTRPWSLGLFPCFSDCKECCYHPGCTNISLRLCFQFFGTHTWKEISGSFSNSTFNFIKSTIFANPSLLIPEEPEYPHCATNEIEAQRGNKVTCSHRCWRRTVAEDWTLSLFSAGTFVHLGWNGQECSCQPTSQASSRCWWARPSGHTAWRLPFVPSNEY